MTMPLSYRDFLEAKMVQAPEGGFVIAEGDINPLLKPHQKAIVIWACAGGRRAIFAAFGLGKSFMQIELLRLVGIHTSRLKQPEGELFGGAIPGAVLQVAPLGVRLELLLDANTLATGEHPDITAAQRAELSAWLDGHPERRPALRFINRSAQVTGPGHYLSNYEPVRDGKLDPRLFMGASLDEASCLRGFGGTKTFREFMRLFDGMAYKFVATATPSPNEFIELLAYSAFLEAMDVGQAKTRFFKRNSEKADTLTIHPHKEREFWLWVASWGLFVERPSDLGFSDEGYDLPDMEVHWHELPSDHSTAGEERNGQKRLLKNSAASLPEAAHEKRGSIGIRIDKLMELRALDPAAHRLIWHDLEAERHAIEKVIPSVKSVWGSQDMDAREGRLLDFAYGRLSELSTKPVIAGQGGNYQRFCHWEIFLGIGHKFNDIIQAIHRVNRFLQREKVRIDLIYTEAERPIRHSIEAKWARHIEQRAIMTGIIREFGLSRVAMAQSLTRTMEVKRVEVKGQGYKAVNNDCVDEVKTMLPDSVDLIVTSIPFSTQYEYSPSYRDFGHTDDDKHFWAQMDYLVPELLRVLRPGRVAMIHVKDRIVPGGLTGLSFQTLSPFSDDCAAAFRRHGFAYLGRKTVTTDVVRENNQTYRLGWSEQCKDGSRMGWGLPEYCLLFRKPPTDGSNGYADNPVVKPKKAWEKDHWETEDGYSRGRWQLDAHGYTRSDGNRFLTPAELRGLEHAVLYKLWKRFSLNAIYNFEEHVTIAETLEAQGALPSDFMLLPPHSEHPDVWTDITRMLSMNTLQAAQGRELHLCPLQFDIIDRAVAQYSQKGETVLDPFGGIMSVPFRAMKAGRKGIGIELNPAYFAEGCFHLEQMSRDLATPDLFAVLEAEQKPETVDA